MKLKMTYNMIEGRQYKVIDMNNTRLMRNGEELFCNLDEYWVPVDPLRFKQMEIELLPPMPTKDTTQGTIVKVRQHEKSKWTSVLFLSINKFGGDYPFVVYDTNDKNVHQYKYCELL